MSHPRTRQRDKLPPDPDVRRAIVDAASRCVREQGVQGLSIAAVLTRAHLSTRAFYRHFESKEQLVTAVFLEMARVERRRLKRRMTSAATSIDAVVAWIDGRLDLAFDANAQSALRAFSSEAQLQIFASPALVQPAYTEMLKPLVDSLQRGLLDGEFTDIDPLTAAESIQGVVWACTERQWTRGDSERTEVRERILRFCLRALGADPEAIRQAATRTN
jgi:AcrR family transcriptional regulator